MAPPNKAPGTFAAGEDSNHTGLASQHLSQLQRQDERVSTPIRNPITLANTWFEETPRRTREVPQGPQESPKSHTVSTQLSTQESAVFPEEDEFSRLSEQEKALEALHEKLAEKGLFVPAPDEEELVFASPVFLPTSEGIRQVSHRPFAGRTFHFHGNYRRFLVFLFFGCLAASPCLYFLLQSIGLAKPIGLTLLLLTITWASGCLLFKLVTYNRRSIALDDYGLTYKDELREFFIGWDELRGIYLHAVEAFFNPYPLCYVRVVTSHNDEFAFANYGNHLFGTQRKVSFGNPPYPIIDVRDADLLLTLLVQHAEGLEHAPDLDRLRFRAQSELEAVEDTPEALKASIQKQEPSQPFYLGLWALIAKFGFKVLPQGLKVLIKSVKPASLGVSVGLYAIIFKWEFALILALILLIHELGHVWAMYRAGMRIRGVYMIPFFGAATVTDDIWPSWHALAKVNLAGPLWGTYMTGLCLLLYWWFPSPFWLMAAVWGALLNLLNLLPIQPLDGGRILNAIAFSLRSTVGFVCTLMVLALSIVVSLSYGFILLYIFSLVGVAEFFREYMLRLRADKLTLLPSHQEITPREVLLLKSITGINFGVRHAPHILEREEATCKRLRMILNAPAMTRGQMLRIGLASFAISASLFVFLVMAKEMNSHAGWAIEIFR